MQILMKGELCVAENGVNSNDFVDIETDTGMVFIDTSIFMRYNQ